jgi:hypothetical protein
MPLVLSGTNGVSGVDGTASNPSYEGTDSNTGIFFPAADTVAIATGGSERVRVDTSGYILGGYSSAFDMSPAGTGQYAQISASSASANWKFGALSFSADSTANGLLFIKSRSATVGTNTVVQSGDALGNIVWRGGDGTNYINAAAIQAWVDGTPGTNDMPGRITFSTTADGSSSITERMRIDSSGNVGIGTSSPGALLNIHYPSASFTTLKISNSVTGVAATDGFDLVCGTTGEAYVYNRENERLLFGTNNTTQAIITAAGLFQFNSGYGSVATAFGCRAWVNFNGTANTNLSGTYSQSGTTVTVTATAHGLIAGNVVYSDITTGTAVDGTYTVATVTDANTFTYTAGTSLTTSGNITLLRNTIRASGNVSSVADNGTGNYTVNFSTAMPDANYAAVVGASLAGSAATFVNSYSGAFAAVAPTTTAFRFQCSTHTSAVGKDAEYATASIFR